MKQYLANKKYEQGEIIKNKMNEKAASQVLFSRLTHESNEAKQEEDIIRAKQSDGWRLSEVEKETQGVFILNKLAREEMNTLKRRQLVRETHELQEFERKLKQAYAQKELMLQMQDQQAAKEREKVMMREIDHMRTGTVEQCRQMDMQAKEEEYTRKLEYRKKLQDQMIDNYRRKQEEYKAFLEEKGLVDDSIKTILEEDKREHELKLLKIEKTKEELEMHKKAREMWLVRERRMIQDEDRKIREYIRNKEEREKQLQEESKRRLEAKALAHQRTINFMLKEKCSKEEKEAMAIVIAEQNDREKEEMKEREEFEKMLKDKAEFREVFAYQVQQRLADLEREKMRDLMYAKKLMEENEEALRKEKEEMERKRERGLAYKQDLIANIQEKKAAKIMEMERAIQEHRFAEKAKEERLKMIEEERLRMLKEHAANLIGFLPPGVLKESDLDALGPQVKDFYSKNKH